MNNMQVSIGLLLIANSCHRTRWHIRAFSTHDGSMHKNSIRNRLSFSVHILAIDDQAVNLLLNRNVQGNCSSKNQTACLPLEFVQPIRREIKRMELV